MARADMFIDENGNHMTKIFNSDGKHIKTIPTDPSQIRGETKSYLFEMPDNGISNRSNLGIIGHSLDDLE